MHNFEHRLRMLGEMRALVTIVDKSRARQTAQVLHMVRGPLFQCRAYGTASSDMMDLLGLGSPEKALLFGFYHDRMLQALQADLREKVGLHIPGRGVSFSVPLSGMMLPFHRQGDIWKQCHTHMENEVEKMNTGITHDLIVAVVEEGGCERIMTAARAAGATGGTTFHVLRMSTDDIAKFFGFPVQAKRDVVAILVRREEKLPIMTAINDLSGDGEHSILFSMPADDVMGLGEPEKNRIDTE